MHVFADDDSIDRTRNGPLASEARIPPAGTQENRHTIDADARQGRTRRVRESVERDALSELSEELENALGEFTLVVFVVDRRILALFPLWIRNSSC